MGCRPICCTCNIAPHIKVFLNTGKDGSGHGSGHFVQERIPDLQVRSWDFVQRVLVYERTFWVYEQREEILPTAPWDLPTQLLLPWGALLGSTNALFRSTNAGCGLRTASGGLRSVPGILATGKIYFFLIGEFPLSNAFSLGFSLLRYFLSTLRSTRTGAGARVALVFGRSFYKNLYLCFFVRL